MFEGDDNLSVIDSQIYGVQARSVDGSKKSEMRSQMTKSPEVDIVLVSKERQRGDKGRRTLSQGVVIHTNCYCVQNNVFV